MIWTKPLFVIFEAGAIVRVPFPYVEREGIRARPALIVSSVPLGTRGDLFWALMITSEKGRQSWPGDIAVGADHRDFGLPVPCLIRTAKLSTLPVAAIDRLLGRLPPPRLAEVRAQIARTLGYTAAA